MTREECKNIAEAISFKIGERQRLSLPGVNELIDQIYNDHEAQLQAKDEEIERLKAESKQAYIEGSKSCDDLLSFYITKIASLEEKLKVSNDSAIK